MTNKILVTPEQVPDLFPTLWDKLTKEGTKADHQALAVMIANLNNLGCDQNTITILVIWGEFKSWRELAAEKYTPEDYHDLGISVFQAKMISEGMAQSLKRKALPSDNPDKSLRWALIKRVCEHSIRNTMVSA